MKAIILAAGYATRLYPLTKDRPKALLPVGGKPILDHLMKQVAEVKLIDEAHIITNHKFATHFSAWADAAHREGRYPGIKLHVWDDGTMEDGTKLGAVGDIRYTIEKSGVDDDILVAASDNFFTFSLKPFIDDFYAHGCDTVLAQEMTDVNELKRFAVATLDDKRRVTSLVEKPEVPPSNVGVYGLYIYRKDTLPLIKQYLDEGNPPDAPGHLPEWLYTRRDVRAYLFDGECIDIGTPAAYKEICEKYGG